MCEACSERWSGVSGRRALARAVTRREAEEEQMWKTRKDEEWMGKGVETKTEANRRRRKRRHPDLYGRTHEQEQKGQGVVPEIRASLVPGRADVGALVWAR